jgi:hypothetical protein
MADENLMLDITPHVNLLRSYRGERVDYLLVVGEGVDNAFDAGAKMVAIGISDDEIRFQDDGIGITRDRIVSIFSIGDHGAMATTQLGRFGIGIKAQAINAGDAFAIDSTSRDGRVRAEVNWRKILQSGERRWKIPLPRWIPFAVGSPTGTIVSISDLRKTPRIALEKIRDDLSQRFYPAIANGQRIYLNSEATELLLEPKMTNVVERQFQLSDGRGAHLRAGILAEPSKLKGVHVGYKHRVIMPQSNLGCGEYSGLNKMFARIQLSGPWHIARFKNDLSDDIEKDELDAAIYEALVPILKKCSAETMTARIAHMLGLINEKLPEDMRPARPRTKNAQNRKGSKIGRKGGFVDDKSDEDDSGPVKTKRPRRDQLLVTFDGDLEQDGVGVFKPGKLHRVNLSKEHEYVAELMVHRDERLASNSLTMLAIAIYEEGLHEFKNELPLFGTFGQRLAKTFGIQDDIKMRETKK